MDCSEVRARLPAAVLFEIGAGELRRLHRHLARCDACLAEEVELQRTLALARAHGAEVTTDGFTDRVLATVAADESRGRALRFRPSRTATVDRLAGTLLTAAATLLLVLGLQTLTSEWSGTPSPPLPATALSGPEETDGTDRRLLRGTMFDPARRTDPRALEAVDRLRSGDRSPLDG
jgi:anti-sigma factor RsiW